MKAIIITIGDEILLGQILDTNSQYISRQLTRLGAEVADILSIAIDKISATSAPKRVNCLEIYCEFVSRICPNRISSPIVIIIAFIRLYFYS